MLPKSTDARAPFRQHCRKLGVALLITAELSLPVVIVRLGLRGVNRAPVPETAVNEHDDPPPRDTMPARERMSFSTRASTRYRRPQACRSLRIFSSGPVSRRRFANMLFRTAGDGAQDVVEGWINTSPSRTRDRPERRAALKSQRTLRRTPSTALSRLLGRSGWSG